MEKSLSGKNIVYSTDPDFQKESGKKEKKTPPPEQQNLYIHLDRKGRKGKVVTIVTGFVGTAEDAKFLGRVIKSRCGVGGSVKNGEILVQGNVKDRVLNIVSELGYQVKKAGG